MLTICSVKVFVEQSCELISTPVRWLHLECERQNSGQGEIHPREDYVCFNCRSPAANPPLEAEDMEIGLELSPQPAPMHIDSETGLSPTQKHKDLEPAVQLSSEMHNDPKPELLAVPLHLDPEPAQATVQEEKLATPDQKPGGSLFKRLYTLYALILSVFFSVNQTVSSFFHIYIW